MVGRAARAILGLVLAYLLAFLVYRGLTVQPCAPDEDEWDSEPDAMERARLTVV